MRILVSFLFIFLIGAVDAQLNCKTFKGKFGDSIVCFHSGGQKSTLEYRYSESFNYWIFIAFDTKGNKIFEGGHGYRHGGGSLDVNYHSNGCISRVRSTFQPDGGIQYSDVTAYFNEDGSFKSREDNSPDRTTLMPVEISPQKHMEQTVYEKESVQFVLKNLTGRKLNIYLISKKDPNDRRIIVLRKNKEYTIGYVERESEKFGIFDQYQIEVLPIGKSIKTLFITDDQIKTREKEVTLIIRVDQ
ncbi:MAG: hypothetical protein ACK46O_10975 [Flavobacteriia bacterium]